MDFLFSLNKNKKLKKKLNEMRTDVNSLFCRLCIAKSNS